MLELIIQVCDVLSRHPFTPSFQSIQIFNDLFSFLCSMFNWFHYPSIEHFANLLFFCHLSEHDLVSLCKLDRHPGSERKMGV